MVKRMEAEIRKSIRFDSVRIPLGNKPVLVTDQAIRKVKAVKVQGLEEDSEILKEEHQKLLKFAQRKREQRGYWCN